MKKLLTSLFLLTALIGAIAQNCGRVSFPTQLPQSICSTDQSLFLTESGPNQAVFEIWGDGVISEQYQGGFIYYFAPDQVELNDASSVSVDLHYATYDDCQNWVEITQSITVENCQTDCGSVGGHLELPEEMCSSDNAVIIDYANGSIPSTFQVSGNGVELIQGIYYFNPEQLEGTTALISYSDYDDCEKWQTVQFKVIVKDCETECGTIGNHLNIPQSICSSSRSIFITGPNTETGTYEIWGDGLVFESSGDVYFDPTDIDKQIATINYSAFDDCQNWVTISFTIVIEKCTATGINDIDHTHNAVLLPNHITSQSNRITTINGENIVSFMIYNANGKVVREEQPYASNISTAELRSGYYIISAKTSEGLTIPLKLLVD